LPKRLAEYIRACGVDRIAAVLLRMTERGVKKEQKSEMETDKDQLRYCDDPYAIRMVAGGMNSGYTNHEITHPCKASAHSVHPSKLDRALPKRRSARSGLRITTRTNTANHRNIHLDL
jgi:hypothetical protein